MSHSNTHNYPVPSHLRCACYADHIARAPKKFASLFVGSKGVNVGASRYIVRLKKKMLHAKTHVAAVHDYKTTQIIVIYYACTYNIDDVYHVGRLDIIGAYYTYTGYKRGYYIHVQRGRQTL